MKTLPLVTLVLALGANAQTPAPSATPALTPEQKMAMPVEKVMKNIQVLNGMPMNQLAGTMSFIASSLGVRCDHCHTNDFSSDDKAEKKTARKMIAMQMAINRQTFEGKPEVSCYTCHRGSIQPRGVPSIDPADWKEKPGAWSRADAKTPEPKPEELFERFIAASGGKAALAKHRTRLTTGTEVDDEGRSESLEVLRKAPLQYVATATGTSKDGKPSTSVQAFDGAKFWVQHGDRKPNMIWTPQTAVIRRSAEFATPLELLELKDAKVRGMQKSGERLAWVVDAAAPDGRRERLFLDEKTGLLARRVVTVETYLGRLQYAVDYDDYRDVDGAKVPFVCRWSAPGHGWTETVTSVKNDVEAPEEKFRMPAGS